MFFLGCRDCCEVLPPPIGCNIHVPCLARSCVFDSITACPTPPEYCDNGGGCAVGTGFLLRTPGVSTSSYVTANRLEYYRLFQPWVKIGWASTPAWTGSWFDFINFKRKCAGFAEIVSASAQLWTWRAVTGCVLPDGLPAYPGLVLGQPFSFTMDYNFTAGRGFPVAASDTITINLVPNHVPNPSSKCDGITNWRIGPAVDITAWLQSEGMSPELTFNLDVTPLVPLGPMSVAAFGIIPPPGGFHPCDKWFWQWGEVYAELRPQLRITGRLADGRIVGVTLDSTLITQ